MKVTNQKPAELSPLYSATKSGQFNPIEHLKENIVKPLFTPLTGTSAVIQDDNGQNVTEDDICDLILATQTGTIDPIAEDTMNEIFSQTLLYFEKTNNIGTQDLFANQAASKENAKYAGVQPLPFPSATTVYTPGTDVIPSCREFIAGKCSYEKMFASFAFWKKPTILAFYFINEQTYNEFVAWVGQQVALETNLPADTTTLFQEFAKTTLKDLTESYTIRANENDNNHDYSFARMIVSYLMEYNNVINNQTLYGIMPFNLSELFCPKNILFINLDAHAKATANTITKEWTIIEKSLTYNLSMISNKKLQKLTAVHRNLQKMTASAAMQSQLNNNQIAKAKAMRFRKSAPTNVDLTRLVQRILKQMTDTNRSENIYKMSKTSFQKPNRRNPDDFNKPGKIVSQRYKPDIHIYIDTSGSISERNYEDAVKACIALASKLQVNLYFNSFSHILSQCSHLRTKGKSKASVYNTFMKIPKVTGGTDYEQIWHYINQSAKRRRELSLILTDFEWTPASHFVQHPKNLYYIPCSNMNWKAICHYAEMFGKAMLRNEPNIRKHILF